MNQPSTIYEVLAMLADYHQQRAKQYEQLKRASNDPRAEILLERLVELEEHSVKVIHEVARAPCWSTAASPRQFDAGGWAA